MQIFTILKTVLTACFVLAEMSSRRSSLGVATRPPDTIARARRLSVSASGVSRVDNRVSRLNIVVEGHQVGLIIKSRIRETLNISMCANISTNTTKNTFLFIR